MAGVINRRRPRLDHNHLNLARLSSTRRSQFRTIPVRRLRPEPTTVDATVDPRRVGSGVRELYLRSGEVLLLVNAKFGADVEVYGGG